MNNINYICARWRDAITDPPPDGWTGIACLKKHGRKIEMNRHCLLWGAQPGDQWLDITAVPAVPAAEIETLVTAAFIRRYPGGQPEPEAIPCVEERRAEPAEIEAQRTLLIEEMIDHGMHAEDAALSVDGLIGVCERGMIPREAVQAAVLEMRGQPPFGCDTWQVAEDILIKHTGVTPMVKP